MAIEPVNLADPVALVFQVDWSPFLAAVAGIVLALVLGRLTEYFTSTRYNPAKAVGQAARSGATSSSMSGLAVGFQASAWVMLVIALALLSALELYADAPIPVQTPAMFYGVALIATGMLTLTGNIVAMSGFGAVASSANQVGQQQGLEKNPRNALEDLEAVGTPMKMMTRGVAAGAAVLTVVALLGTVIISSSALLTQYGRSPLTSIDLMHPVFVVHRGCCSG
ncbi:MAG: sodium-translocating pyrophosphatase, partial [Chloroflexaceae bacterium]|nr:sodium-translocating pyrophosphatase [Chloroflexaceae bacterium]